MKHRGYLVAGIVFLLLSTAGWKAFLDGSLLESRNPNELLSFLGTPIGGLFLVFGAGWKLPNSQSRTAARFAVLSLGFAILAGASELGVRGGVDALMTAVGFCVMASSFLALITLVFLVRALVWRGDAS